MDFKLRAWEESDLEQLVKIADNFNIAKNLSNHFPHPYTRESGRGFIQSASEVKPYRILAIEVDGLAVGTIGIHAETDLHIKNGEMGYWLGEPYWGKGIMTKAVRQMVNYGFENFDITRIFARCFGRNIGSQKVLEKAGFVLEAKFEQTLYKNDEYIDELIYAIRRNKWERSSEN